MWELVWGTLATWGGLIALVVGLFSAIDVGAQQYKKSLSSDRRKSASQVEKWGRSAFLFDRLARRSVRFNSVAKNVDRAFSMIFGDRILSARSIRMSWRYSLFSVIIGVIIIMTYRDGPMTGFTSYFSPISSINFWVFALTVNASIDFISLVETRLVLRKMAISTSIFTQLSLLFIDIILSGAIFVICLDIWLMIVTPTAQEAYTYFQALKDGTTEPVSKWQYAIYLHSIGLYQNILSVTANLRDWAPAWLVNTLGAPAIADVLPGEGFSTQGTSSEMFFMTTFFTSLFIYLVVLTQGVMIALGKVAPAMRVARRILPWQQQPFFSLGCVAAGIVSVLFWATLIFS